MTKLSIIIICACGVLLCVTSCSTQPSLPQPTVESWVVNQADHPDGFFPADPARVAIKVTGDARTGTNVSANVDVVFLIDESGSMATSDPDNIRHAAVKNLLNSFLSDGAHFRAGVVVFSDDARILGSFTSLTNNFNYLIEEINSLPSPGGSTNIAQAMSLANSLLSVSGANHRIAVLLTDGYPENAWGYDMTQDVEITNMHVPYAIEHDINYYVVHLLGGEWTSNPDLVNQANALLTQIWQRTRGGYRTTTDANNLTQLFSDIVNTVYHTIIVKNIQFDLRFRVDDNSYSIIIGQTDHPPGITPDESDASQGIIRTGPYEIPALSQNEHVDLTPTITAYEPFPPMSMETEIDLACFTPEAKVYYDLGDGQQRSKIVPQVVIKWLRPPEVLVRKRLEPNAGLLTISVTNYHRDSAIRDVRLGEILGSWFEAELTTMNPEPRMIIPLGWTGSDYFSPIFVYELEDIQPLETKQVSFTVRYAGPPTGQVDVDNLKPRAVVWYTAPDGQRQSITAITWYGDRIVDAATLLAPSEYELPDLYVAQDMVGENVDIDLSTLPPPRSDWIWNDAEDNGWLQPVLYASGTTPDPLHLRCANRLWFHLANIGTRPTKPEFGYEVTVYCGFTFSRSVEDYTDGEWKLIGSKQFTTPLLESGGYIVDYIEWTPRDLLTTAEATQAKSSGRLFIKLEVRYQMDEIRYFNNTAFVQLEVYEP